MRKLVLIFFVLSCSKITFNKRVKLSSSVPPLLRRDNRYDLIELKPLMDIFFGTVKEEEINRLNNNFTLIELAKIYSCLSSNSSLYYFLVDYKKYLDEDYDISKIKTEYPFNGMIDDILSEMDGKREVLQKQLSSNKDDIFLSLMIITIFNNRKPFLNLQFYEDEPIR